MNPLIILGLASLGFGVVMGFLVSKMAGGGKVSRDLSRKVFHVGIFTGAVPAHLFQGFWGVVVYGSVVSIIVLLACFQGPGFGLYEALARPAEGGGSRRNVLTALSSTALGGLLGTLLVGSFALVGYLVCGWGDAVGEPAGERWGRHRYASPLGRIGGRTRSVEGSFAVFLVGSLGACVSLGLLGFSLPQSLGVGLVCGGAGAGAEGLSPSGTDNLWVQLLPALVAWWCLG